MADPWVRLSKTAIDFAELVVRERNRHAATWTVTSPMAEEISAHDADLAGEWGSHPVRDVGLHAIALHVTATDHLRALGVLLRDMYAIASPHVVARAAIEASALSFHLLDPEATSIERVRRLMNERLISAFEAQRLAELVGEPVSPARSDQVRRIEKSAPRFGLRFIAADSRRAAYLDSRAINATRLAKEVIGSEYDVGSIIYKLTSAVAHARSHGLSRFITRGTRDDDPLRGDVLGEYSTDPRQAAVDLYGAPVAVSKATDRLFRTLGWELGPLAQKERALTVVWREIAQIPPVH